LKLRIGNELILINLLVVILIVVILLFPSNILRIALGFPFLLFFPGYALVAALFTKKESIGGIERVALSIGLSITVVSLIGLILNYTPWGIRLESILCAIGSFVFITSITALVRRGRLTEPERFSITFNLAIPSRAEGAWDNVLCITLALTILSTLGMLGYVIATPRVGDRFTEFYVVGLDAKAADYPRELATGEEGGVIVGIINREGKAVFYWVEVRINGVKNNEVGPIVLKHDETWEGKVSFTPEVAGEKQKAEFLLYKDEETEPCLEPLRLWLDVIE